MNEMIHAGFESEGLSFVSDMTIDELITIIIKNVDSFEEAMKASELLEGIWMSGTYEGTGWRFWFSRRLGSGGGTVH